MSCDGKSQSRIAASLLVSRWLRADSVSFNLAFCRLARLKRYACSLRKIQSLDQVGGEGNKEKNKKEIQTRLLNLENYSHPYTLIYLLLG